MSDAEIRKLLIDALHYRGSGGFLTAFSECMLRADSDNFALLKPAAEAIIKKYGLKPGKEYKYDTRTTEG